MKKQRQFVADWDKTMKINWKESQMVKVRRIDRLQKLKNTQD